MIKVMIVDDDKLVRLGLLHTMPWSKHDMTVVGEAANGNKAMEFIKENEIDLMFIDIEMPGMSGLELLKSVKALNSSISCVMLTMHQEFTYIQDSLRLGVLDYIIKTELSEDNFDEVLERIKNRLHNISSCEPESHSQEYSREICGCIDNAVKIIEEELGVHISVTELAKRVNMSRSYFSTCFKQIMNISVNDYFKKNRMELAKTLLKSTDNSIARIASETGFSNEKYFSSVFKSYTGVTPSEFRKV